MAAEGVRVFIEIGPDGTLSALGPAVLDGGTESGAGANDSVFVPALRSGQPAAAAVLAALGRAHVHGTPVDWAAVLGRGQRVDLPTYAFQLQRFWPRAPQTPPVPAGGDGAGVAAEARFWSAVDDGDLAALADILPVDGQQPFGEVLPALASWRRQERDRSAVDRWRYRVSWAAVPDQAPARLSGTWLVVVPAGQAGRELGAGCAAMLAARGALPEVLNIAADPGRAALAALIAEIQPGDGVSGVLSLLALDEAPLSGQPPSAVPRVPDGQAVPADPVMAGGLAGTLTLVQALGDAGVGAPLWVLTCGAVAAGTGEALASPVQAQAWGLGRAAALEHPDRWGGLADVPPVLDERAAGLLAAVLAGCGEDQVAVRQTGIVARRLARAPLPRHDAAPWVPTGTVLVTGGTGAIGGHVARWLAKDGAPRVVLAGRSGPAAAGAAALAADMAGAGTAVEVTSCDVAVREQAAGLLARIAAGGPPLAAVMHAAGIVDDGLLDGLSRDRLAAVLAAKAAGAAHLDELTRQLDLEQFVLFSSAAATFGGAGQGNYAAANAFLDALAQQRAARGLAALSVAWGPWEAGMTQASAAARKRQRRGPLLEMDPALAVRALEEALAGQDSALAVMDVDWSQFATAPSTFVADLPEVRALAEDTTRAAQTLDRSELARRLAGTPRARQIHMITDLIRSEASAVLGHTSADAIDAERAFSDHGFDSLTSLEMRQHLTAATGLRLPATLLFDYPTPAVLAEYLHAEAFSDEQDQPPVLDELDRLAALLSSIARNDESRSDITARLEAMTEQFRGDAAHEKAVYRKLATATNDEMFGLVEEELNNYDSD